MYKYFKENSNDKEGDMDNAIAFLEEHMDIKEMWDSMSWKLEDYMVEVNLIILHISFCFVTSTMTCE